MQLLPITVHSAELLSTSDLKYIEPIILLLIINVFVE